jgi:pimeloyl-ACP methyl ester carboxylesterase
MTDTKQMIGSEILMLKPTYNSVTLHYEIVGKGSPVVYIYGAHSNDEISEAMCQQLSHYYMVLVVNTQGAGLMKANADHLATIEDMADDIAAVMDSFDLESAHIIGQSTGNGIALMLALRHPDKVRSLVPIVAAATYATRFHYLLTTARKIIEHEPCNFEFGNPGFFFENEIFLDFWNNNSLAQTWECFQQQLHATKISSRYFRISVPTIVINAPGDCLVPPHHQNELDSLIPETDLKLYVGGHLFFLQPESAANFVRDLFAFLDKRSDEYVRVVK